MLVRAFELAATVSFASLSAENIARDRGPFGIGPVAGRDPTSAAHALQTELARRSREQVAVAIPGSATALVEVAVTAGLRFSDPGLLLLVAGAPSLDAGLIFVGLLQATGSL
jgi:hypothetical protein